MRTTLLLALVSYLSGAAFAADIEQEKLHNWHQWRGPLANGFAPEADPPTTWGPDSNVRWKAAIPGQGESTPIVWQNRIFLTTAIETDREEEKPPAETAEAPGGNPFRIERTHALLPVRGAVLRPRRRQSPVAKSRHRGRASRRTSPRPRLRLAVAGNRRAIRLRLIRLAWYLLL